MSLGRYVQKHAVAPLCQITAYDVLGCYQL